MFTFNTAKSNYYIEIGKIVINDIIYSSKNIIQTKLNVQMIDKIISNTEGWKTLKTMLY